MRNTLIIGILLGLAGVNTLGAAPPRDNASFATTKQKIVQLRTSVISRVTPPVQVKIRASAEAVRQYLGTCGRNCKLYPFLRKDLNARFARLTDTEFRVLFGLVFAEIAQSGTEAMEVRLQEIFNRENQVRTLLTNLMNEKNETSSSVIDNIKL